MGIFSGIKSFFQNQTKAQADKLFSFKNNESASVISFLEKCTAIYKGRPEWIDADNEIKTVNFARPICSEIARLTMLDTSITISGSSRADWLNKQLENCYDKFRGWIEMAAAYGTVIFKPNGISIECYKPNDFILNCAKNGMPSAVFRTQIYDAEKAKYYTRYEFHRFDESGNYLISNKCFISDTASAAGDLVDINKTAWSELSEDVSISGVKKPLFSIFKMPGINYIDDASPLGLPIFSDAIEELHDLDVAYSRNVTEINDSRRIVLMDSDTLMPYADGIKISSGTSGFAARREMLKLPKYVRNVLGNGRECFYEEINPSLETEKRLTGINALLSQIGFKCGFSNGYFVFNEKSGMITATQVESDDRRTIQLIKDIREQLQDALERLIYALDAMADLYSLAPLGEYELVFKFGDITYNYNEDKAMWYSYVCAGRVPFWYYLTRFEGLSENDAKAIEAAANMSTPMFSEEE